MKEKKDHILELLNMRVGENSIELVEENLGYLVLVNCKDAVIRHWSGPEIQIELTADCTITLSRIQVILENFLLSLVSIISMIPTFIK